MGGERERVEHKIFLTRDCRWSTWASEFETFNFKMMFFSFEKQSLSACHFIFRRTKNGKPCDTICCSYVILTAWSLSVEIACGLIFSWITISAVVYVVMLILYQSGAVTRVRLWESKHQKSHTLIILIGDIRRARTPNEFTSHYCGDRESLDDKSHRRGRTRRVYAYRPERF